MPVLMFTFYSSRVACNIIGMGNCCYILYGRFCKNLMNEVYNGSHAFLYVELYLLGTRYNK
ncbi:hypothetical protein BOVAC16_590 [Bacteroides ovatus]|nr:hypothetical protein BOVAC16_590 [Bacteroides ovatus]